MRSARRLSLTVVLTFVVSVACEPRAAGQSPLPPRLVELEPSYGTDEDGKITSLKFWKKRPSDADLALLADLTALESLRLTHAKEVTGAGLRHLARMTSLGYLDLEGTSVADGDLRQLAPLKKLDCLLLTETKVTGPGLAELKALPALRALMLRGLDESPLDLTPLAGLSSIEYLELRESWLGPDALGQLAKMPNLKRLDLEGVRIGPSKAPLDNKSMEAIGAMGRLEFVSLGSDVIDDEGLTHLRRLRNLQEVKLQGSRVTNQSLALLKGLPALKEVDVSKTAVDDAGVRILAMSNLESLSLPPSVTDAGLKALAGSKSITRLTVQGGQITEAGLHAAVAGLPGLDHLAMWEVKGVTTPELARIAVQFPQFTITRDGQPLQRSWLQEQLEKSQTAEQKPAERPAAGRASKPSTGETTAGRSTPRVSSARSTKTAPGGPPTDAATPGLAEQLIGTWVLVGSPDKVGEIPEKGGEHKHFTGSHFAVVNSDPGNANVLSAHGGRYTLEGDVYEETVDYASPATAGVKDKAFRFRVKIDGDALTMTGIGNPWNQVLKRAK